MTSQTLARPERGEQAMWELAITSFVPATRRRTAGPWVRRLPLGLLLVLQAGLSGRLLWANDAFADEALYSNAGHVLLNHLGHGTAVPASFGEFFSGAPYAYPVLSAALDTVGGLWLTRAWSLAAVLLATVALSGVGRHLWGRRGSVFTAASFVSTGPVMFVGGFATFDATCVALLSGSLWLGMTRRSARSAVALGVLLAVAVVFKYTCAAFVPIVLAATVLGGSRPRLTRAALAALTTAGLLGAGYALYGSGVRAGILFTTTGRKALIHGSTAELVHYALLDAGILLTLAFLGAQYRSWRRSALSLTLLSGGLLLPLAQLRLGEAVSFEKHLAYSAVFLAPLAARALLVVSRRTLSLFLIFTLLWVSGVLGLARSHQMFEEWPPVQRVIALVEQQPTAGLYLSNQAPPMAYYTRKNHPEIRWEEHYGLYDSGDASMIKAVADRTYQVIALRAGPSGNPVEDKHNNFFIKALRASHDYQLAAPPFPTRRYATDRWLVFRLRPAPAAAPTTTSLSRAQAQAQMNDLVHQFGLSTDVAERRRLLGQMTDLAAATGVRIAQAAP